MLNDAKDQLPMTFKIIRKIRLLMTLTVARDSTLFK